uniref:Uncharacterized protein n=1 Tax=Salix viminalis TaxID=40686 RepID=A0A6N2LUG7_SALVM
MEMAMALQTHNHRFPREMTDLLEMLDNQHLHGIPAYDMNSEVFFYHKQMEEVIEYNEAGGYRSSKRLPPKTLNIADSLVTNERKEYQLSLSYKSQRNIGGRFDHAGDPWMFVKDLWMLLFCGWSGMLQINFAVSKCISRE